MKAVFLDSKTFSANVSFSAINKQCSTLTCFDFTVAEQRLERCRNAEIVITNKVILDSDLLQQLPTLRLICVAATGMNNIDLMAAKKFGITVYNVSNYAGTAIAQYVFAQLLTLFHRIDSHNQDVQHGLWQQTAINSDNNSAQSFCYHGNAIEELAGKNLAIVGYGNLGKSVANVAQAFAMPILIAERKNATTIRTGRVSFNEALSKADIVSLHCPQTADTIHLIDTDALSLMKKTAILINTARGKLIDNMALINALAQKQICHAILDVLDQEPPPADHPLLSYQANLIKQTEPNNLTLTAHIAWASTSAQQRLINLVADNIKKFNTL